MTTHQATEWPLVEDLTAREREILEHFAEGKSDREIAEKLILSLSTVKWYARQIYGKLGVENRKMAVARGQQLGLLGALPASSRRPDLPTFLTPFVGREQEVQEICQLLVKGDHRLVTLTGPGGIGKTRLAVQVVHRLGEQQPSAFADGVCFVSLAGLTAPAAIVTIVGSALGVSFGQGSDPQAQLCNELRPKRMLLVLDNMEHLLAGPVEDNKEDKEFNAVEFVFALLHAAADLRIIVTSRSRLGVQGEQLYPLDGLAYPENGVEALPELLQFSAVQLFLQHVQRVQPNYHIQDADGHALGRICRLLEGMPLAIELAAAWIRVMSSGEIAAEISASLDFLSTNLHNLPPRHRSLRAIFERSWQLLSSKEQEVLSQLSVFRGGFTREAGEVITGLTLAMLSHFVDHSLIRRQVSGRFDLHELLRQFLDEKLYAESSEWEQAHQRHAAYYGARFVRLDLIFGLSQEEAQQAPGKVLLSQVADEIDNIGAAWRWAVQHQEARVIRQLMNPLADYYQLMGILEEGGQAFDDAIAAVRSTNVLSQGEKNSLEASLLLRRSLLMIHYQHHEALKLLNQSLDLLGHSAPEYHLEVALAFVKRGQALSDSGRSAEGVESIKEGLSIFQVQNHWPGVGYALYVQGMVEKGWGRLGKAAETLTKALRLLESKNLSLYWFVVHMLATVFMLQGRYRQAETLLRSLIDHYAKFYPPPTLLAYALRNRGDLAIAMGNLVEADEYFAEATTHFVRMGMAWHVQIPLAANPGVIARLQGELDEAERLLTQNLSTARQVGFQQRIAINLHNLARLRHDQGRYPEAMTFLDEALQIGRQIDSRFATALALCQLGHSAAALKQPEAIAYYTEALQIATAEEIDRVAVDVLLGIAQQLIQNDDSDFAVALLSHVENHPASDFETKHKAHRLLVELEAQLPTQRIVEGRRQGEALTLQEIISTLWTTPLFS